MRFSKQIVLVALSVLAVGGPAGHISAQQSAGSEVQTYEGTVVGSLEADVAAQSDGLISKIYFRPGQEIQKGDLLFEFSAKEKEFALALARAKLRLVEADLSLAEVALRNARTLKSRNVTSDMQLLEAEAKREIAVANVEEATANVNLAQLLLEQMKLYAPITGVISRPFVREGSYITKAAQTENRLASVVQLDPVRVVGRVPYHAYLARRNALGSHEKAASDLAFGLIFPTEEIYPLTGQLVASSYAVDQATQTVAITVEFPNPNYLLRPGLAVRLRPSVDPK